MELYEGYEFPRYTRDHFAYYKQVCEWYLELDNKKELLDFHFDRTNHFKRWLTEREELEQISKSAFEENDELFELSFV